MIVMSGKIHVLPAIFLVFRFYVGCYLFQEKVSMIANKVKNYNSMVVCRGIEKRKLKKFNS